MTTSEFMKKFGPTLDAATKLKASMTKRSLRYAKAVCPMCAKLGKEGFLVGRLVPSRGTLHLHMHCTGECGARFME